MILGVMAKPSETQQCRSSKWYLRPNPHSSVFFKFTGRLGIAHSTGGGERQSYNSLGKFTSPPVSGCPLTFIRVTVQICCFDTNAASSPNVQMQSYEAPWRIWQYMFYIAKLSRELPSGNPLLCRLPSLPEPSQSASDSEQRWLVS